MLKSTLAFFLSLLQGACEFVENKEVKVISLPCRSSKTKGNLEIRPTALHNSKVTYLRHKSVSYLTPNKSSVDCVNIINWKTSFH